MAFQATMDDFERRMLNGLEPIDQVDAEMKFYMSACIDGWLQVGDWRCKNDCRGWDGMNYGRCDCGASFWYYHPKRHGFIPTRCPE